MSLQKHRKLYFWCEISLQLIQLAWTPHASPSITNQKSIPGFIHCIGISVEPWTCFWQVCQTLNLVFTRTSAPDARWVVLDDYWIMQKTGFLSNNLLLKIPWPSRPPSSTMHVHLLEKTLHLFINIREWWLLSQRKTSNLQIVHLCSPFCQNKGGQWFLLQRMFWGCYIGSTSRTAHITCTKTWLQAGRKIGTIYTARGYGMCGSDAQPEMSGTLFVSNVRQWTIVRQHTLMYLPWFLNSAMHEN